MTHQKDINLLSKEIEVLTRNEIHAISPLLLSL